MAPDWKQLKWPIKQWIDKQTLVHSYSGVLLSKKKDELFPHAATAMDLKVSSYTEWKKPIKRIYTVGLYLNKLSENKI